MREVGVQAGAQGAHLPTRGSHHPHLHPGSPSAQTAPPSTLASAGRPSAAVSHGTRWELKRGSDSPTLWRGALTSKCVGAPNAETGEKVQR